MVSRFKQLCNKSQEWVPVAVYVLTLGPDSDTPYFQLPASLELYCMKPTISIVCRRLYNQCSLTQLLYSAHLCSSRSTDSQGQGWRLACQVQCWAFVAFQRLPFDAWSFEQRRITCPSHWLACISQTGWHGGRKCANLEIKLCNIWESPCWN